MNRLEFVPMLNSLPRGLQQDGAISIELGEGVPVLRASLAAQDRIEELLQKQQHAVLTPDEDQELRQYADVEDYLSHLNRLARNLAAAHDIAECEQAEKDLRQMQAETERQRRLYDTILSNTPDLAYVFDLDHRFTYANDVLLKMWGKTWDEAIGKNCLELGYEPWHAAMHDREIEQVIATKQPIRGEVPFTGTFGRRIYDYIFVPVIGASGEVEAIAGTTRDITERKQAEEEIKSLSERNRDILESIADGFFAVDRDWRFTYVNAQAELILDRKPGDLIGNVLWDVYPGLAGSEFERAYQRTANEGVASTFTSYYPDHDRWYEVKAYPAPNGVTVYFRNVTERVQSEKALREAEERFRLLTENAEDYAMIFLDADARITTWNIGAERILGWAESEAIGQPGHIIFTPEDRADKVPEQELSTAAEKGHARDERWHIRKDGSRFFAFGEMIALYDDAGSLRGFAKLFRDLTERKKIDDALRQSEKFNQDVIDSLALHLAVVDKDGVITAVNEAWRQFAIENGADRTLQGVGIGTNYLDVCRRSTREKAEEAAAISEGLSDILDGKRDHFTFEYPCHAPDCQRWFLLTISPLADGRGAVITHLDITERRRAEERVRESEARFRRVFTNNMVAMGIWTKTGGITSANDALLDLIGYTRQELEAGQINWVEITPPEYHERDLQAVAEVEANGVCALYEKIYVHKDGRPIPIVICGGRFDEDAGIFLALDLTERKLAEESLRQSEEKYRGLFNSIDEGYCIIEMMFDTEGKPNNWRFLEVNSAFEKQNGLERAAGKTILELAPNIEPKWFEIYGKVAVTGEAIRFVEHSAALQRWFDLYAFRFGAPDNGQVAVLFDDITERIRAGEERERLLAREQTARAEAEAANRLKDEFLATLSHELRTPLTSILGWTRLLQTNDFDAERSKRALETIERNARAQNQLIDDLLDVSRIITGKLRLDVSPVDLSIVIEAAVDAVRPAAEAKDIRLRMLLDSSAGAVSGDADRLQQVVWNLLANAVKFTPKGGRVEARLERVNSHLEIVVSDTGQGIAQEFLPHVFDRFRQADQSATRTHGGLGLGLSIVRQLVEQHGGVVEVESAGTGQGTTFTVKLPRLVTVRRSEPDKTERVHPTSGGKIPFDCAPSLAGLRIFVVDDEPDTRELLRAVLERCDSIVTTAGSAAEAFAVFRQTKHDVLVCDIGMPEEDGYTLIGKVRALPAEQGGRIPAIALTAYARTEDRVRALTAGFQVHVPKPVEPVELAAVVASLAGRTGRV